MFWSVQTLTRKFGLPIEVLMLAKLIILWHSMLLEFIFN